MTSTKAELPDPLRTGTHLVGLDGKGITRAAIQSPAVITIHGFTASADRLGGLHDSLEQHGFSVAALHYHSFAGIDNAAHDLSVRLKLVRPPLQEHGFVLLGHSMGGLVARYYAQVIHDEPRSSLRGIITLGTPHIGFQLKHGKKLLQLLVNAFEYYYGRLEPLAMNGRSARQMLHQDPERLLYNLTTAKLPVPVLSVSGGLRWVAFAGNSQANVAANKTAQLILGKLDNDGLVRESNANPAMDARMGGDHKHDNAYRDYLTTNHTALPDNQLVRADIVEWLHSVHGNACPAGCHGLTAAIPAKTHIKAD